MKRHVMLLAVLLLPACASQGGAPESPSAGEPVDRRSPENMLRNAEPSRQMLEEAARAFDEVRKPFLDWYTEAYPLRAAELGMADARPGLPSMDRGSIQDRIEGLLDWEARLSAVPESLLRGQRRLDYAVLAGGIRAELLELEEIRRWAADPLLYTRIVVRALPTGDDFVGAGTVADQRALTSRIRGVLEAARENLESPPRVWTELAIAETRGLMERLEQTSAAGRGRLMGALESHLEWLETTLLPRSTGNFALGRYLLLRQLLYEEHVDLSVEELDRLNQEAMADLQDELARVAGELDPDRSPRELLDSVADLQPAPEPPAAGPAEATALRAVENDLRRVFLSRSLQDGWAHYRAQMRLDSVAAEDRGLELLRLQRALSQHARWYAAMQLHAGGQGIDEVVRRVQQVAHVSEAAARADVLRATYDPMYLNAALGRMQILELREDYEAFLREQGESFSRRAFEERLLELGLPPTLAREILIPLP